MSTCLKFVQQLKFNHILALVALASSVSSAQAKELESMSLQEIAIKSIQYSLNTQVTSKNDPNYLPGEWPTQIQSTFLPVALGVGKLVGEDEESTIFATASVMNVLGRIYLDFPELRQDSVFQQIPVAMNKGQDTFSRYQDHFVYNFYPPYFVDGVWQRRPMDLKIAPLWLGLTNIPNDADTTSVTEAAIHFNALVNGFVHETQNETFEEISKFRDTDREPMFYNKNENIVNTGAFLTWLIDENDPSRPKGIFAHPKLGARIPFGDNDVDCVINANVFKMKAMAHKTEFPGYAESCQMIQSVIERGIEHKCGVYYPNTLNIGYSMASAAQAGDGCLSRISQTQLVGHILKIQNVTGGWTNVGNRWKDPNISTAFAMYALLQFANLNDPRIQEVLSKGTHYLLAHAKVDANGLPHWYPDSYFTATALARSMVLWRSEAYTDLIISSVLLQMNRKFPENNTKKYLDMPLPLEVPKPPQHHGPHGS